MANKIKEFDLSTGNWQSYVERLEMVFLVKEVKVDMQVPTLISVIGESAYELMVNLCSPTKPKDKSFKDLCKLMADHLQPKPSVLAERYRFRQCRQQDGVAISEYLAELKKMARFCEFGANLSENMRDQFVCGLANEKIRQRLFTEAGQLDLVEAVRIATAIEAAERDASAVVSIKTEMAATRDEDVHQVHVKSCLACGDMQHSSRECRYQTFECSGCRKIGHLRRVCPEGGSGPIYRGATPGVKTASGPQQRRSGGSVRRGRGTRRGTWRGSTRTHHLEDSQQVCGDDYGESDQEEPIYQMSLKKYKPVW